jgi:hypothetical protein
MDLASVLTLGLLALFLAVQPWSVLAGVLLVSSRHGVTKTMSYAAGWLVILLVVALVTTLLYPNMSDRTATSRTLAITEIVAGCVLGMWLLRRWHRRAEQGTKHEPSWMKRIDGMSPVAAFALGAFLPSYVVVVGAVTEMLDSGLRQGALALVAVGWALLASAGVAAPLAVIVFRRDRAPDTYERWRGWIVGHSRAVLLLIGGLVCGVLVAKGLVALLG